MCKQITKWARHCPNGLRELSFIVCLPLIAIAISLAVGTSAAAQAPFSQELFRLEIMGGDGGNNFEHLCAPGRVLVGVRGHTGLWIDNVQAVCAKVQANTVSDAQPEGQVFGGDRPLTNSATCANGTIAAGLEIETNKDKPFLGSIKSLCADFMSRNFVETPAAMKGSGLLASVLSY